jgi:hypothetical protein
MATSTVRGGHRPGRALKSPLAVPGASAGSSTDKFGPLAPAPDRATLIGSEGDLMRLNGWKSRARADRYADDVANQRALEAKRPFVSRAAQAGTNPQGIPISVIPLVDAMAALTRRLASRRGGRT